jgi:hypothetical protein
MAKGRDGCSDAQARYWARKEAYRVAKARGRQHVNNHGGYQLLDDRNTVVAGVDFDLSATEVVDMVTNGSLRK